MSNNLDLTQLAASQNNKETTINDTNGELDAALTEMLDVDLTSADATVSAANFRRSMVIRAINHTVARQITLPAVRKMFLVINTAAGAVVTVTIGLTSIEVSPEGVQLFYADGTTSGLHTLADSDSVGVSTETGATYTPSLADAGAFKRMDSASTVTVTIPANADVAFPIGTTIAFEQTGIGTVEFEGDGGVTINCIPSLQPETAGQFGIVQLAKLDINTWTIFGALRPTSEVSYVEGSWTPALEFATNGDFAPTVNEAVGWYTRVGNTVLYWARLDLDLNAYTTASGEAFISGLPFDVRATDGNIVGGAALLSEVTLSGGQVTPVAAGGTDRVELFEDDTPLDVSNLPASTPGVVIVVSGAYRREV